jgi:hypothetical protein
MSSTDDANEPGTDYRGPLGYAFAVADRAWCCWEYDHRARTLEFLDGVDPEFFSTMAEMLGAELDGDQALAVSVTLRMLYVQAIETLLGLLGATLQAPDAVAAWIAACTTQELDALTRMLLDGRPLLTQAGRQRVSFVELSEHVHRFCWPDETGDESTAARFGRFWRRLASDYLDDVVRAEHNALKHGHRVTAGGFSLAIGLEEASGVPAPAEAMRSLGASKFGTSFFRAERVGASRHHIRARRSSVNWSAVAMANRLLLIAMSIGNVVGALRCQLGVDPTTVVFHRPTDPAIFDDVWNESVGIRHSNMDSVIRIGREDEVPREDLLNELESRTRTA